MPRDKAENFLLKIAVLLLDAINNNEVNENGKEMGDLIYQLECFLPNEEDCRSQCQ